MTRSAPPSTNDQDPAFLTLLTLGIGFVIPGAGHISIGQVGRGLVFGITIGVLFFGGLLLGGVQCIGPKDQPIWNYTQYMAFGPMMAATALHRYFIADPIDFFPKLRDVGSVYCGVAGMLNMLVLFDAFVRISGFRKPGPVDSRASKTGAGS